MKKKDIEILKDVLNALLDKSQDVKIETLWPESGSKNPRIPQKNYSKGPISTNHMNADSVTLGSGTTIRRIRETPTKHPKGYEIDTGWHWIVRSPHGDAFFTQSDKDLLQLWGAALNKADKLWGKRTEEEITNILYDNIENQELRNILKEGPTKTEPKNKYEKALLSLKALGVTPKKLAEYIASKQHD